MRFSTLAVAAAAVVSAQDAMQSVCDKYTVALLQNNTAENQYTLLTLLVKTVVIGNFTGNGTVNPSLPGSLNVVPGILAAGEVNGEMVNLLPYFNGSLLSTNRGGTSGVSVNFLDGAAETGTLALTSPTSLGADGSNTSRLLAHLIQFFGAALGCSMYGTDGFPSYMGDTGMASVHQYMDLSYAENTYFIQQVGLAATSFGASMEDVNGVAMLLNTTFNQRCAPPAAVLPSAMPEYQVICAASDCPLAATTDSICTGAAGFGTFTASEPGTATASGAMTTGTDSSATMTGSSSSAMMTESTTGSMSESMSMSMTETTGTATGGNNAPRQTAAAGVMAAAGLVAAAFL